MCLLCARSYQTKIINLDNILFSESEKNELINRIYKLTNFLNKFEEIKNNIIIELDKIKESNYLEIQFIS